MWISDSHSLPEHAFFISSLFYAKILPKSQMLSISSVLQNFITNESVFFHQTDKYLKYVQSFPGEDTLMLVTQGSVMQSPSQVLYTVPLGP